MVMSSHRGALFEVPVFIEKPVTAFVCVFPITIDWPIVEAEAELLTVSVRPVPEVHAMDEAHARPEIVHERSSERSSAVPFIVSVRVVGTYAARSATSANVPVAAGSVRT